MPVEPGSKDLLAEIEDRTGAHLSLLGVAEHGETNGALYVRWPDGHASVVTRSQAPISDLRRTAEVLALARRRGLPVPRYELTVPLPQGVAVVQERMPGASTNSIDQADLAAIVAMNERCRELLAGRADIPVPDLRLQDSEWHRTLERYNDRSRELLRAIRPLGDPKMVGHDLVHPDLVAPNILFDSRRVITGIVDWDGGAARGDARFALVKLRFDLAWCALYPPASDRSVASRLDEVLDAELEPGTLLNYWAHWSLRMLHWTIRHHGPEDIDLHLDLALSRLR